MMGTVNLPANQVAQGTADEYIRGEMLFAGDARQADGGCSTIRQRLTQPSVVFVGDYRCKSEGQGGMTGRERKLAPTLEKPACAIVFDRALPLKRILERLKHN